MLTFMTPAGWRVNVQTFVAPDMPPLESRFRRVLVGDGYVVDEEIWRPMGFEMAPVQVKEPGQVAAAGPLVA